MSDDQSMIVAGSRFRLIRSFPNVSQLSWTLLLNPNPKRVSVCFFNQSVSSVGLDVQQGTAATPAGILLQTNASIIFLWKDHPAKVVGTWWGRAGGAGVSIYILEEEYIDG